MSLANRHETIPVDVGGVTVGETGRVGVYYSREDLTAGLVGYNCHPVDGYQPESAYAIMRNIILLAGK